MDNKIDLITGASDDIAFEIAKQFAQRGYVILPWREIKRK